MAQEWSEAAESLASWSGPLWVHISGSLLPLSISPPFRRPSLTNLKPTFRLAFWGICCIAMYSTYKQGFSNLNWTSEIPLCVCAKTFSHSWLFLTLWTVAHQDLLSSEFSRQWYWSWLPFPPPRDPPDSGIESTSLVPPELAGRFFTTDHLWPQDHLRACKTQMIGPHSYDFSFNRVHWQGVPNIICNFPDDVTYRLGNQFANHGFRNQLHFYTHPRVYLQIQQRRCQIFIFSSKDFKSLVFFSGCSRVLSAKQLLPW